MIIQNSIVNISDNSGAKKARCIKVLKNKKVAKIGDFLLVTITATRPGQKKLKIKKGDVYLALLIRSAKKFSSKTGISTEFKDNSICLLNKQKKLLSTRIYGPIPKVLKKKKLLKLATLSFSGFF